MLIVTARSSREIIKRDRQWLFEIYNDLALVYTLIIEEGVSIISWGTSWVGGWLADGGRLPLRRNIINNFNDH